MTMLSGLSMGSFQHSNLQYRDHFLISQVYNPLGATSHVRFQSHFGVTTQIVTEAEKRLPRIAPDFRHTQKKQRSDSWG